MIKSLLGLLEACVDHLLDFCLHILVLWDELLVQLFILILKFLDAVVEFYFEIIKVSSSELSHCIDFAFPFIINLVVLVDVDDIKVESIFIISNLEILDVVTHQS